MVAGGDVLVVIALVASRDLSLGKLGNLCYWNLQNIGSQNQYRCQAQSQVEILRVTFQIDQWGLLLFPKGGLDGLLRRLRICGQIESVIVRDLVAQGLDESV